MTKNDKLHIQMAFLNIMDYNLQIIFSFMANLGLFFYMRKKMTKPTQVIIESSNIMFLITETCCNVKLAIFSISMTHPWLLCHINIEWRWFDIFLFFLLSIDFIHYDPRNCCTVPLLAQEDPYFYLANKKEKYLSVVKELWLLEFH